MANIYEVQIEDSEGNVYHPETDLISSQEELEANTDAGKGVDALVVKALNNNLKGFTPILDSTGKITGYKTSVGGADTVFPFSSGKTYILDAGSANGTLSYRVNVSEIDGYKNFTADNFKVIYSLYSAVSNTLSGINVNISTPAYDQSTGILTGTIIARNGNNTSVLNNVQVIGKIFVSQGGFS